MSDRDLRAHIERLLDWTDAHTPFDEAVDGVPVALRGTRPPGSPHSAWELLEHLRVAQRDILNFCRNPQYSELAWPDDYWPSRPDPPTADAWEASVHAFRSDLEDLKGLAANPHIELLARIPHGSGQTYLRELLMVADHNAYHIGQLVAVRRALEAWPH